METHTNGALPSGPLVSEYTNGNPYARYNPSQGIESDPICIVGMACRLPGDIRSPSDFWDFLVKGKSAQGPVPPQRFNIKGFYDAKKDHAGLTYAEGGYFLNEDVRQFDNGFFGINNLEATYMDPQQRKLLEVAFECLENAGESMDSIKGTNTGVFVGNFTVDFQVMQMRDPDYVHRYTATGLGTSILSNRISHLFDLHGPSPEQHMSTMKAGILSPTSTCHTFDGAADGYGRGEAVNVVYVKRLSAALRDGNRIRAVVRSTAVNSNGHTPGITQPSAIYQEAVIRKAYSRGRLAFADTDYVECHGTGTAVGDPIEVDAIGRCFSSRANTKLMIGAVKPSLGHSEAASGLTSVMKVALSFENKEIPPTYGITNLNPKLKLSARNLTVVTELTNWPRILRRAGINSFGYGGANSHVVLECFHSWLTENRPLGFTKLLYPSKGHEVCSHRHLVVPVSAASKASLEGRVHQVRSIMEQGDAIKAVNLAFTLSRRLPMKVKEYLLFETDATTGMATVCSKPHETTSSVPSEPLPLAFAFTGQGAQYAGMARELLQNCLPFRATIQSLGKYLYNLQPGLAPDGWTLEETILASSDESYVNDVLRSQPLCTAIQVALVDLLRSWDLTPTAVVGHSSGEIAAAYAAGLLSAEQAILVAYYRGLAVKRMRNKGAMIATALDPITAEELIQQARVEDVCVACINSPTSVTLSGSVASIDLLFTRIQSQGKFVRKLQTDGRAYHSHLMKEVGPLYEELLGSVFQKGKPTKNATSEIFSSVEWSNKRSADVDANFVTAEYWRRNLETPVQFASAFSSMMAEQEYHVIEIGPHSALKGYINQIRSHQASRPACYSPTLIRGQDAVASVKALAGDLFKYGHAPRWEVVNAFSPSAKMEQLHDLPPYPWDYSSGGPLWTEHRASAELRNRQFVRHELLGSRQLAGNGIEYCWRNILQLNEVDWILDHKIENQAVFPAAGYLAMAIEAILQIKNAKDEIMKGTMAPQPEFEFRNVNIGAALVIPDVVNIALSSLELHTVMHPSKLSKATSSSEWHDFQISSWVSGRTILHCAGSLRFVVENCEGALASMANGNGCAPDLDSWSMACWYEKLREQGLNYGPSFQSLSLLQTNATRNRTKATCTMKTFSSTLTYYPVHPIMIDACLQAGILSDAAGNIDKQRAWLPIFITQCRIRPTKPGAPAIVHAHSARRGFSTLKSDAKLVDDREVSIIALKGVRLSLYASKPSDLPAYAELRQPCLRVQWKPDVTRTSSNTTDQLTAYIDRVLEDSDSRSPDDEILATVKVLVDLAVHRKPRMRVLVIKTASSCHAGKWTDMLGAENWPISIDSRNYGIIGDDGQLSIEYQTSADSFDVILAHDLSTLMTCQEKLFKKVASLISPNGGVLISRHTESVRASFSALGFDTIEPKSNVLLVTRPPGGAMQRTRKVVIIHRNASPSVHEMARRLVTHLQQLWGLSAIETIDFVDIGGVAWTKDTFCLSLLEMEFEFLASMDQNDMDLLRKVTDKVEHIAWLTGAGMLGNQPDAHLTLSSGLSRALMLEQPSLNFTIIDVGRAQDLRDSHLETISRNLLQMLSPLTETDDKEFALKDGMLYISRFGPDAGLNELFRKRIGIQERIGRAALGATKEAKLSLGSPGVTETLHFQELCQPQLPLASDHIDIRVKAVSLNAKDVYMVGGRAETREATTALEFSGEVVAVGSLVTHLKPGDRAVVLAPNHFSLTERVPAWAAHKLLPSEEYGEAAVLPVVYATALYALRERAHLEAGESVLIHSGAGALGIAAITVAQSIGSIVYATAGSTERRTYIADALGVPRANIFDSRSTSFVTGIMANTGGHGVDVVLNSLVGDLMHASWNCVAKFGRFIEVGKRELIDAGKLDMAVFLRNASFTAFDLSELFYSHEERHRHILSKLIKDVLEQYRSRKLRKLPITTFDVENLSQAYRYFSSRDRIGKVLVSLEKPDSIVPIAPAKYLTVFSPDKVYLLVGCLGGLGRSLATWMMARGAQSFVFLGRSGCAKTSAKALVSRLENAGATVHVVRGDVVNRGDVEQAIQACVRTGKPIGGVVQAAMGLQEGLFSRLSNEAWHKGVQPKWAGTWNLHNALEGHDHALDFLLLTSSISGTVGTATESNYCAANGFLDAFARWRRSQAKPAISLGLGMISEVGYLHENPDIENLLLRKGIQPLTEDEFLQVVDLGLAQGVLGGVDDSSAAHILTGMELSRVHELTSQGFDVSFGVLRDPRAALLAAKFAAVQEERERTREKVPELDNSTAVPWLKNAPSHLVATLTKFAGTNPLEDAILGLLRKQFSNLILMPIEQIDDRKPLSQFGLDSMIASEFRSWLWGTLKVDIPFLDILGPAITLQALAITIKGSLGISYDSTE